VEGNNNHVIRFCIAIFGAILLHSAFAILINIFAFPSFDQESKTIPILLISADHKSSIASKQNLSKAQNAQAAREYLASISQSTFQRKTNTKHDTTNQQTIQNTQTTNTSTQAPNFPSIGTPAKTQNTNAQHTLQGLQNIFSMQTNKQSSSRKQISTKAIEKLSSYEVTLLNRLAQDDLYDPYHDIMEANNKRQINYIISLILFPNGAIKSAHLKSPSGIKEIDNLAKSIAYRASPYPRPPKEDFQKGYRYDIPIIYQRFKDKKTEE